MTWPDTPVSCCKNEDIYIIRPNGPVAGTRKGAWGLSALVAGGTLEKKKQLLATPTDRSSANFGDTGKRNAKLKK